MTSTSKRLVFFFPGFEPMPVDAHVRRFRRAMATTAATWSVDFSEVSSGAGDDRGTLHIDARGAGWETRTELHVCDWSDLIARYAARGAGRRLAAGYAALADFALSGTFLRYFAVSWRYALFFLDPIVLALAVLGAGLAVALLPAILGLSAIHFVWSVTLGAGTVAALLSIAIRRLHLLTLMDDWAFARDLARRSDAANEAGVERHRRTIAERFENFDGEEIVVAGHSLGVSLAVVALAGALASAMPRGRVGVLSVGSSLLKTALHPAATHQRDAVRSLTEERGIDWVDVQAVSDPLNFYRSNPALSLGIDAGTAPVVRRISLRRIVGPETQKRIRRSFFRRHRQFVYGGERRDGHAFHMVLLGPVKFGDYASAGTVDLPPLRPVAGGQAVDRLRTTP